MREDKAGSFHVESPSGVPRPLSIWNLSVQNSLLEMENSFFSSDVE